MSYQINYLIYLMKVVGVPYIWGGKDPTKGLDCSGLVSHALKFFNLKPDGQLNAYELYQYFKRPEINKGLSIPVPKLGDLLFFGSSTRIHHVAIAMDDTQMLEAAHGDETIKSKLLADIRGAKVMVTDINRFHDLYDTVRPKYPW